MNVLSDFALRLDRLVPANEMEIEVTKLKSTLSEREAKIKMLEHENNKLITKMKSTAQKPSAKSTTKTKSKTAAKPTTRKPAKKKKS